MYEINVKDLTTASRDFAPTARDAILDRFARFHDRHGLRGPLPKRDFSQRKRTACSVVMTIAQTSLAMVGAFRKEWYAPGLALLRPALEALLRVAALSRRDDKSDWEEILLSKKPFKVTPERLSAASRDTGLPDLGPLWGEISGPVNDHLHQRASQWLTVIGDEPEYQIVLTCIIHEGRESVTDGACWTASGASRTWRRARQEA